MIDGVKPLATASNVKISDRLISHVYAASAGTTLKFWAYNGKKTRTEVKSIING